MVLILSILISMFAVCAPGQGDSADLSDVLSRIDSKSARIDSLKATFRQVKHSEILRRPLVSSGMVRVLKDRVRWDTTLPSPSVLCASGEGVRIFYPDLAVVEVYALGDRLSQLAGSPVFRLTEIRKHFAIEADPGLSAKGILTLRLTPRTEDLRKHLKRIILGVESESGIVRNVTIINADAEKTEMFFDDVTVNPALVASDLELDLPDGVRIVHPLGGDGSGDVAVEEAGS